MSNFRVFNVDKKKEFLNKAKQNKTKKVEDAKFTSNIMLLQKNIRAFLTSRQYGSH